MTNVKPSTIGVLVMNVGTPDAPTTPAVRRYLRAFLSDRYVISLPYFLRMLLLYGIILPLRPKRSATAYSQVWTSSGSPLLVYSKQCVEALQLALGEEYLVVLGMRYGNPSLSQAVERLQATCSSVVVLPLFPQYAQATTQTAVMAAQKALASFFSEDSIQILPPFFEHTGFIRAYASVISRAMKACPCDVLLMSYHGVPCSHLKGLCVDKKVCSGRVSCPVISKKNQDCYRAQCFATSRALAQQLNVTQEQYAVSFQSRLGANAWVQPFTDQIVVDLFERGHRRLAVVCPAFVSDCLETLEEIGMALRDQWLGMGGVSFQLIPCLNVEPDWVDALKAMVHDKVKET